MNVASLALPVLSFGMTSSSSFSTLSSPTTVTKIGHPSKIPEREGNKDLQASTIKPKVSKLLQEIIRPTGPPSSVHVTPKSCNYFASGFVQCCIIRDVSSSASPLHHRYLFIFQTCGTDAFNGRHEVVAMIAEKQQGNMTSNYHIFDTTRIGSIPSTLPYTRSTTPFSTPTPMPASASSIKLNKKAGNYIGKLRKDKREKSSYSLFDSGSKGNREQIAAYTYDIPSVTKQLLTDGSGAPPRKLQVAIPHVDDEGYGEKLAPYLRNKMIDSIKRQISVGMHIFQTKEPSFENGQYRLNFNGRVTLPSVKNMQVMDEKSGEVVAQFGKVGEHRFHLDYKYPLNAVQVFAMALTSIDM